MLKIRSLHQVCAKIMANYQLDFWHIYKVFEYIWLYALCKAQAIGLFIRFSVPLMDFV